MLQTSFLFFLLYVLVLANGDANFTCPGPIQSLTDGVFPAGVTEPTAFPAKYYCNFSFTIPDGYIVKFEATALLKRVDGSSDELTIYDYVGTQYRINGSSSVFAPAKSAQVALTTTAGYSFFFVKWTFVDVADIHPAPVLGCYPYLLNIPSFGAYWYGPDDYLIELHTSGRPSEQILVYDGKNLTARYLGPLYLLRTSRLISSGHGLVLVNYGPDIKDSQVIALTAKESDLTSPWQLLDARSIVDDGSLYLLSAYQYTFYSLDPIFIEQIQFDSWSIGVNISYGQPGYSSALLSYTGTGALDNLLPQEISTNVFTVSFTGASSYDRGAWFWFSSSRKTKWNKLAPGAKKTILSGDVCGSSSGYSEHFKPSYSDLTISFNVSFKFIGSSDDNFLRIMILDYDNLNKQTFFYYGKPTDPSRQQTVTGSGLTVDFGPYSGWLRIDLEVPVSVLDPPDIHVTLQVTTTTPAASSTIAVDSISTTTAKKSSPDFGVSTLVVSILVSFGLLLFSN